MCSLKNEIFTSFETILSSFHKNKIESTKKLDNFSSTLAANLTAKIIAFIIAFIVFNVALQTKISVPKLVIHYLI